MTSPANLAATTTSSSTKPAAAAVDPAATTKTNQQRPRDAIADPVAAEATAADSFPVFEDFPPEGTPTASTLPPLPPLPLPPLPPPPPSPFSPAHRRRRSRRVTEYDLRTFRGLPNRKVFDYVDLVKALRTPPAPGKFPVAPVSQLGTERNYTRHSQVRATSPPPWAR